MTDRRSTFGRRDFAVLSLLVRLGLRSGEVAAMELADIDWRAGETVIRGKGGATNGFPCPSTWATPSSAGFVVVDRVANAPTS